MIGRKGDTIVEVMIAIVVLGAALGAAFSISNRSVIQTQNNHERYQIQLWMNEQAELIRQDYTAYIANGGDRADYAPGDGDSAIRAKLCLTATPRPAQCDYADYALKITVVNNPSANTRAVENTGLSVLKKYIITADWTDAATGNPSALELRYDI